MCVCVCAVCVFLITERERWTHQCLDKSSGDTGTSADRLSRSRGLTTVCSPSSFLAFPVPVFFLSPLHAIHPIPFPVFLSCLVPVSPPPFLFFSHSCLSFFFIFPCLPVTLLPLSALLQFPVCSPSPFFLLSPFPPLFSPLLCPLTMW